MTERVTTTVLAPDEEELDGSLRPRSLEEFVGQERVKQQLAIALKAAKGRGEALDHVLLAGPPGLGKTSLAYIVREELGVGLRSIAGPALERKGDMAAILTSLEERDVLFVDEIHRLNRAVEEILYPALEDFRLDIIVGQGPAARTLTLDLPPFTLVGATTRTGLLTTPLRDRFGMTYRLEHYAPDELGLIVRRSARILGVAIAGEAADEIARRARGTPRVANRILRRVRDVAEVRYDGAVTIEVAREALALLEVDGGGRRGHVVAGGVHLGVGAFGDRPGEVPLGEDAGEAAADHDDDGPDLLVLHALGGIDQPLVAVHADHNRAEDRSDVHHAHLARARVVACGQPRTRRAHDLGTGGPPVPGRSARPHRTTRTGRSAPPQPVARRSRAGARPGSSSSDR